MPRDRRPHDLAEAEESEVAAFLADPASYAERPERVETIETHAARVFLAGAKAYKVKKRVTLPFLDFSTLDQRRRALARELELNQPHAPEIYLGLALINRGPDGALTFGGGRLVDVALVMNRFDQESLFARIAERGPLAPEVARDLAAMAARTHRAAPRAAAGTSGAGVMRDTVAPLADALRDAAPAAVMPAVAAFAEASLAEVARRAPLLDARGEAGHVRRCHGDLHLGNIVLIDGRAVPFDALEFDERLATIDVLYDLAFLLMDLDVRGDRAAANVVLNAYVAAAPTGGEIEGLAALPLFLATRAAVRAVVALERARQRPEGEGQDDLARGIRYMTAANAYLAPPAPVLIAVGGLSGTGKSTLAQRLAPRVGPAPGALVLRTDVERKRRAGVPETQRLPDVHYAPHVSEAVYGALYEKADQALAAGHGVIFDGVSAKPEERARIAAVAAARGADFSGLWLEAPLAAQIARVEARRGDASDSDEAVVRAQAARDVGALTWTRIDAGRTPEHTLDQARAVLAAQGHIAV